MKEPDTYAELLLRIAKLMADNAEYCKRHLAHLHRISELGSENAELRRDRERLRGILESILNSPGRSAAPRAGKMVETLFVEHKFCLMASEALKQIPAMSEQPAAATCQCAVSCIRANGGDVLNLDGSPKICRGLPGDNHPMRWHNRQPAAKESNHG